MQTLFGTRSNHYFSKLFIFPTFPQFLDENSALGSIEIFYVDKKAVGGGALLSGLIRFFMKQTC